MIKHAKKIFLFLALLNFFDGVVTYFGLQSSIIEESNPIMLFVYRADPLLFLACKIGFSVVLLFLTCVPSLKSSKWVVGLASMALLLYTNIALLHIWWIGLYFT